MDAASRVPRRDRSERGQNLIEFGLVFLILLAFISALFNFGWALFVKATLHQAVQAGVRFAITGPDGGDAGQDAAIKDVVAKHTIGLINAGNLDKVKIEYFRPDCIDDPTTPGTNECLTTDNSARNIIAVRIEDYTVPVIAPALTGLMTGSTMHFSVVAMDKVEPFPGSAPRRDPITP